MNKIIIWLAVLCIGKLNHCDIVICVSKFEGKNGFSSAMKIIFLLLSSALLCFCCETKAFGVLMPPRWWLEMPWQKERGCW